MQMEGFLHVNSINVHCPLVSGAVLLIRFYDAKENVSDLLRFLLYVVVLQIDCNSCIYVCMNLALNPGLSFFIH